MTKQNEKQIQHGLETLAANLDAQRFMMHYPLNKFHDSCERNYSGRLQTLAYLGGDYVLDDEGHHRVFLAGTSSAANDEYVATKQ